MQTKSRHPANDGFVGIRPGHERGVATPTFQDVTGRLQAWDGATAPSVRTRDAIAGYLAKAFPTADVSVVSGAYTPDVRIGDIGIVLVQSYNSADSLDATFGILAEQYEELVFYSTQLHANSPDMWRLLERRYTAGRLGIERVAFLTDGTPVGEDAEATVDCGRLPMDCFLLVGGCGTLSAALGGLLLVGAELSMLGQAFYGAVAAYLLVVVLLTLFVTSG